MKTIRHACLTLALTVASGFLCASAAPLGDAEFVRRAALSDMFETESSELAAIKGDAATREFAVKMNEGHQKTSSELGVLVKDKATDLPLPARLDADLQRKVDRLSGLDGTAFTSEYANDQVAAHEEAIRLFTDFASSGSASPLRSWAEKTLPKLKEHLQDARSLMKSP